MEEEKFTTKSRELSKVQHANYINYIIIVVI